MSDNTFVQDEMAAAFLHASQQDAMLDLPKRTFDVTALTIPIVTGSDDGLSIAVTALTKAECDVREQQLQALLKIFVDNQEEHVTFTVPSEPSAFDFLKEQLMPETSKIIGLHPRNGDYDTWVQVRVIDFLKGRMPPPPVPIEDLAYTDASFPSSQPDFDSPLVNEQDAEPSLPVEEEKVAVAALPLVLAPIEEKKLPLPVAAVEEIEVEDDDEPEPKPKSKKRKQPEDKEEETKKTKKKKKSPWVTKQRKSATRFSLKKKAKKLPPPPRPIPLPAIAAAAFSQGVQLSIPSSSSSTSSSSSSSAPPVFPVSFRLFTAAAAAPASVPASRRTKTILQDGTPATLKAVFDAYHRHGQALYNSFIADTILKKFKYLDTVDLRPAAIQDELARQFPSLTAELGQMVKDATATTDKTPRSIETHGEFLNLDLPLGGMVMKRLNELPVQTNATLSTPWGSNLVSHGYPANSVHLLELVLHNIANLMIGEDASLRTEGCLVVSTQPATDSELQNAMRNRLTTARFIDEVWFPVVRCSCTACSRTPSFSSSSSSSSSSSASTISAHLRVPSEDEAVVRMACAAFDRQYTCIDLSLLHQTAHNLVLQYGPEALRKWVTDGQIPLACTATPKQLAALQSLYQSHKDFFPKPPTPLPTGQTDVGPIQDDSEETELDEDTKRLEEAKAKPAS